MNDHYTAWGRRVPYPCSLSGTAHAFSRGWSMPQVAYKLLHHHPRQVQCCCCCCSVLPVMSCPITGCQYMVRSQPTERNLQHRTMGSLLRTRGWSRSQGQCPKEATRRQPPGQIFPPIPPTQEALKGWYDGLHNPISSIYRVELQQIVLRSSTAHLHCYLLPEPDLSVINLRELEKCWFCCTLPV